MWVIIERYENHCWISGVYKNHQDAQDYLSIDLEEMYESAPSQEIREIPAQDYPVFFLEDFGHDFFYVTPEELTKNLFNDAKTEDDDHDYCTYYIFRKDYRISTPGQDEMGIIAHDHVDNAQIKYLIQKGLFLRGLGHLNGFYECRNCSKLSSGVLCEAGYQPPPGWHIIQEEEENGGRLFMEGHL
jgi:hypothetical protein